MSDWTAKFRGIKGQPLVPRNVTKYFKDQQPYTGTEQFVDEMFPPTSDSILSTKCVWDQNNQNCLRNQGNWSFIRPSEFLEGDYCVYDENVTQDDINQGYLGDCYFLSALAAMTEFPGLINQNFKLGGERSENGYYEILMFIDEQWQIVILDDYIPCLENNNYPQFAKPTRNVIWMLLLEKAWAKINDGFSNIIAGKSVWPFHILTGFPTTMNFHHNNNLDEFWEKIKYFDSRNDIMACGAGTSGNGIVSSHQYTLRFAGDVKDDNGTVHRLVCLRNPWGCSEWQGDWSDNSDKWTAELKQRMGVEEKNDGMFYMPFDDFVHHFDCIEVAHSPNYNKNVALFNHQDSKPKVYSITVETVSTLTVNVYNSSGSGELHASVFLSEDSYHFNNLEASLVCSNCENDGRIYNLNPGKYTVAVYPHSKDNFTVRFSNNGRYRVQPNYVSDHTYSFLEILKSQGICNAYHNQINNSEFGDFLNTECHHKEDYSNFCNRFTCLDDTCSEYSEVGSKECINNMVCWANPLVVNNLPKKQSNENQPKLEKSLLFQNNQQLIQQLDANHRYLTVYFPSFEVHKVKIDVRMRDQGWATSSDSASWMEAVIEDKNGNIVHIENLFKNLAVPDWKDYSVVIDESHNLFKFTNSDFVLHLVARSAWGWEIWIKSAKCQIN